MRSPVIWFALILAAAIGGGFYFWKERTDREARLEQIPASKPEVAQSAPPAADEPEVAHPLPPAPPSTPDSELKPLPPLSESDEALHASLATPLGSRAFNDIVISKDIARRIVATVDNLPRRKASTQLLPFKAPARQLAISRKGERVTLSGANYARYVPYVKLAQAVDAKRLVALYVRFYPLFQQAYEELGYPKKYFNDRAVEAIDDLLAVPDVDGPVALVQPKVVYEFADPELEELSAGQKLLIRIGPQNAAAIKAKLREVRHELVADAPAPDR